MCYFADAGPARGPLRYGEVPGAIGVLEVLDNPMPGGRARGVAWGSAGQRRAGRDPSTYGTQGQEMAPHRAVGAALACDGCTPESGAGEVIANPSIMWM